MRPQKAAPWSSADTEIDAVREFFGISFVKLFAGREVSAPRKREDESEMRKKTESHRTALRGSYQ